MSSGLDLSFGYTPMQFEKINLLGADLSEHAVYSLVLSVPNITYLDLRGNKLDAAFGWRLVKAMKKRYLNLEFCNGVPLRALRTNAIESLNLSSFHAHHGMYGIEVVGAIFLAHFLRLNTSLTYLNFKRNDVEKDGAKALAQSLLGNPQCVLRHVNTMGPTKSKPGVDFGLFRSSQLQTVHLSKRLIDDDDFVFIEEWLRRYDCVTDLDISWNLIWRDGARKLARYVKDSKSLVKLNCVGLPVDLEGSSLLARAVVESQTLASAAIHLGPCDDDPKRQELLQQLGIGLATHPSLQTFATTRTTNLEFANIGDLRMGKVHQWPPERSSGWPKAQMAVYMWCLAAVKAPIEKLQFGPMGAPAKEYPEIMDSQAPVDLWPSLLGVVHDAYRSLHFVSIAFPKNYGPRAMEMLRVLTRCSNLKTLFLLNFASAVFRESQLPPEWGGVGAAPRWLIDDRIKQYRVHWQALNGMLSALPHLESFNDVALHGLSRDQPELTCLLLMQCLKGVAVQLTENPGGETLMKANIKAEADVDAFCDVLRLLSRTPLLIEFQVNDKRTEIVKRQQARLTAPLSGVPAGDGPRFTHAVVLKNNIVSEDLLKGLDCHAPLREFTFQNIDSVLPALFAAFCGREKPLPVEKIKVEPKWMTSKFVRKRFDSDQRRWLDGLHAALIRSDRFMELKSASKGALSRNDIEAMSLQEFAEAITGVTVDEMREGTVYNANMRWRCFPSKRAFLSPAVEGPEAPEKVYLPLPMDDEARGEMNLTRLSLCMCELRPRFEKLARPDEFPDSSRPLWFGRRRFARPGDWDEYFDGDPENPDEEENVPPRYHWREQLRIGSRGASAMIAQVLHEGEPPFADVLLHDALRSLLDKSSSLTSVDLRGNGLTREDATMLLSLLEGNQSLMTLNGIPVLEEEAQACTSLCLDGSGIEGPPPKRQDDPYGDDDEEDPPGQAFARDALEADVVRMDEGDGYLFLQLVIPQFFPALKSVTLKRLEIPSDSTLAHITDALLGLRALDQLYLSNLRVSSNGASLVLQAIAEMASRLSSLNGLPLAALVARKTQPGSGPLELPQSIEWNDYPLGAMARLNLWPYATLGTRGQDLNLQGKSLTDVGLRGLCVMLRHFAGEGLPQAVRSAPMLPLSRIDLSGNQLITDATVADLCHTLLNPTMGATLKNSLKELSVRSCMRLRTRSAFELLNFMHRAAEKSSSGSGGLHLLNGVDLEVLQNSAHRPGQRSSGPPMLLRSVVSASDATSRKSSSKLDFASLSECDTHFFAGVLHHFPHIPYCHLHVVVNAASLTEKQDTADGLLPWGRSDDTTAPFSAATQHAPSNDSPFPQPKAVSDKAAAFAAALQLQIESAKRFFEACPIASQLRVSVIPTIPGLEDRLSEADTHVLATLGTGASVTSGVFGHVKQELQAKAAAKRKKQKGAAGAVPSRPLYVNNINSQQLHCCFRTLYGKNDVELEHHDIMPKEKKSGHLSLPSEVDVSNLFGVATSVDLQHLDLSPANLLGMPHVQDMPVLTHVNLNFNHLGDAGVELLFKGLVDAGASVVHVSLASNNIGDEGATCIATALGSLPRLTSLELCNNSIQERGSIALADAIGGVMQQEDAIPGEEVPHATPLPVLSVDLKGNRSRELGARRWAEVVCSHPDLKFLCLAQNELACLTKEYFLDLVAAAVESHSLSVLDLQDNFAQHSRDGVLHMGPPPADVIEELLAELPNGEFDPAEVKRAVFIRRLRGNAAATTTDKKGRQPQQGQPGVTQRHGHSPQPGS